MDKQLFFIHSCDFRVFTNESSSYVIFLQLNIIIIKLHSCSFLTIFASISYNMDIKVITNLVGLCAQQVHLTRLAQLALSCISYVGFIVLYFPG